MVITLCLVLLSFFSLYGMEDNLPVFNNNPFFLSKHEQELDEKPTSRSRRATRTSSDSDIALLREKLQEENRTLASKLSGRISTLFTKKNASQDKRVLQRALSQESIPTTKPQKAANNNKTKQNKLNKSAFSKSEGNLPDADLFDPHERHVTEVSSKGSINMGHLSHFLKPHQSLEKQLARAIDKADTEKISHLLNHELNNIDFNKCIDGKPPLMLALIKLLEAHAKYIESQKKYHAAGTVFRILLEKAGRDMNFEQPNKHGKTVLEMIENYKYADNPEIKTIAQALAFSDAYNELSDSLFKESKRELPDDNI